MQKITIFILIFLLQLKIIAGQQNDEFDAKREVDVTKWKLKMVHKISWNSSKNFAFVHRESAKNQRPADRALGKEHNGRMHLGNNPCGCGQVKGANCDCPLGEAEMSFPLIMNQNNMLIKFHTNDGGKAYCEFGLYPEHLVDNLIKTKSHEEYYNENCLFKRKKYLYEHEEKNNAYIHEDKLYAFCSLDELFKQRFPDEGDKYPIWKVANGIYNKPSNMPQCLYDFHVTARKRTYEYDLFSYCAKAYFFQGKDYNDPARLSEYRKDWLLFLANGKLVCGISGKAEDDRKLLGKGYKIELVHLFDQHRFYPELELCPELEASLAAYEDKNADGEFLMAAIVGSAQLDGDFKWKYVEKDASQGDKGIQKKRRFWDEGTYRGEYEEMLLDNRLCYLLYHKMLKWNNGTLMNRFRLQLRITHYCTPRGMRDTASFDVSISPYQPPDNIYEDRGIVINLDEGIMKRTTGQKLCAIGMPQTGCEIPPKLEVNENLPEHAECQYSHQCARYENDGTAMRCRKEQSLSCFPWHVSCKVAPTPICEYFLWDKANAPEKCDYNDLSCHDDAYCLVFTGFGNKQACRKLRFKQEDELCFVSEECFPPWKCKGPGLLDGNYFGTCRN